MISIIEGKVRDYLRWTLGYNPYDVGTIVFNIRGLARMAGYELDDRFAGANLGAGPEARVASGIVGLALGKGGCESSMYAIRDEIGKWLRRTPPKGMIG